MPRPDDFAAGEEKVLERTLHGQSLQCRACRQDRSGRGDGPGTSPRARVPRRAAPTRQRGDVRRRGSRRHGVADPLAESLSEPFFKPAGRRRLRTPLVRPARFPPPGPSRRPPFARPARRQDLQEHSVVDPVPARSVAKREHVLSEGGRERRLLHHEVRVRSWRPGLPS